MAGATADQILSSGTGLVLMVLVARAADATTFGALSVALIVNGLMLGIQRAAVGEVFLLRCRHHLTRARSEARLGLLLAIVVGTAAAAVMLAVGTVVGGEVGRFLQIVAIGAPFVYAQDLLRLLGYATGRLRVAVAVDGMWLGVQVTISAGLIIANEATPTRLLLAWLAGAVASPLFGCIAEALVPRGSLRSWWHHEHARVGGFVGDFAVSTGMVQASFLAVGIVLPLAEFGALRVAFVSLSPLANLLTGVRTLTLAHFGGLRDSPTRALRRAAQVAVAFAACGAIYGGFLVLLPESWGAELFGSTWMDAAALVGLVVIGEVCRVSAFTAIDLVKVFGRPVVLVRTRAMASVGVVVGLFVGAIVAGPRGAAGWEAVAYLGAAVIWWRQALRAAHRRSG